jgi:hypothetical protein
MADLASSSLPGHAVQEARNACGRADGADNRCETVLVERR